METAVGFHSPVLALWLGEELLARTGLLGTTGSHRKEVELGHVFHPIPHVCWVADSAHNPSSSEESGLNSPGCPCSVPWPSPACWAGGPGFYCTWGSVTWGSLCLHVSQTPSSRKAEENHSPAASR